MVRATQDMDLSRVYKEIEDGAQRAENTRPLDAKTGALPSTRKSLLQRFKVWCEGTPYREGVGYVTLYTIILSNY